MEAELVLLEALIAGPQPAKLIPLAESTRMRHAKRLESLGYLTREAGAYRLTHEGYAYALNDRGVIPPAPAPYFEFPATDEFKFRLTPPPARPADLEWVEYVFELLLLGALAFLASLMMVIRIWHLT